MFDAAAIWAERKRPCTTRQFCAGDDGRRLVVNARTPYFLHHVDPADDSLLQIHIACTGVKHDAPSIFPGHGDHGRTRVPMMLKDLKSPRRKASSQRLGDFIDVEAGLGDSGKSVGGLGFGGSDNVCINLRGPLKGPIAGAWAVLPSYNRISMFATGVGITPMLSVFLALCDQVCSVHDCNCYPYLRVCTEEGCVGPARKSHVASHCHSAQGLGHC